MQKYSKIALILSTSLLFHPSANRTAFAMESKEQINVDTNDYFTLENGVICSKGFNNIQKDIDRYNDIVQKVNERFDKIEERKRLEEQKRIEEENSYNVDFTLTHYGRDLNQNGGYTTTCTGESLREGIVASNYYKLGTIIELEDGRRYIVADTGSNEHFLNPNRLDVFVDTYDNNYLMKLGKYSIKGKVIKE